MYRRHLSPGRTDSFGADTTPSRFLKDARGAEYAKFTDDTDATLSDLGCSLATGRAMISKSLAAAR